MSTDDLTLVIPLDYTWDAENTLNKGRAYVEVPVEYDPDLPVRGERRVQPYGPCPIVLREPNQQVLLHEILHIVIAGYGRPDDPHAHRFVNRIEVALWETGWRMTDPRYCTAAPAMPDPTAEQVEPDLADLGWAEVVHDTRSLDCIGRDHGACVWPENCVCPCHDVCTCATNDDQHDAERCHVGLRTPPGSPSGGES